MPSATFTVGASSSDFAPLLKQLVLSYKGAGGPGRLELTGSQTYSVDLAMLPGAGAKGLLVLLEDRDASNAPISAPVTVQWTSASVQKSQAISAAPGIWGAFLIVDAAASAGVTALNLISTANAVVHVVAVG